MIVEQLFDYKQEYIPHLNFLIKYHSYKERRHNNWNSTTASTSWTPIRCSSSSLLQISCWSQLLMMANDAIHKTPYIHSRGESNTSTTSFQMYHLTTLFNRDCFNVRISAQLTTIVHRCALAMHKKEIIYSWGSTSGLSSPSAVPGGSRANNKNQKVENLFPSTDHWLSFARKKIPSSENPIDIHKIQNHGVNIEEMSVKKLFLLLLNSWYSCNKN